MNSIELMMKNDENDDDNDEKCFRLSKPFKVINLYNLLTTRNQNRFNHLLCSFQHFTIQFLFKTQTLISIIKPITDLHDNQLTN